MNTQKHDTLTDFLIKHDYIVKCVVKPNMEVECQYNDLFQLTYKIVHIDKNIYDLHIFYCNDKNNNNITQESILLPAYIIRWYIFLDIIRLCKKHNLSHNIIRFFDVDGNIKNLVDLLNLNFSENDANIEKGFVQAITAILKDNSNMNKFDDKHTDNGTFYNFSILKGLMI